MTLKQFKPSTKELFYVPLTPASEEIVVDKSKAIGEKEFLKLLKESKSKKTVSKKNNKPAKKAAR